MQEALPLPVEGHQIVQHGVSVLYKPRIIQFNAQLTQSHDHLHTTLGVSRPPGRKTAIVALLFRHARQCFLSSPRYLRLILILGQCLQSHTGDVWIGYSIARTGCLCSSEQAPPSIGQLALQNAVDIHLTGRLYICLRVLRHGIACAIQCNQRPNWAVKPLPNRFFVVAQRFGQVISSHISGIFPD